MFATVAAVLFGIALLLDLIGRNLGIVTPTVLMLAGLTFFALHFSGAGSWRGRRR